MKSSKILLTLAIGISIFSTQAAFGRKLAPFPDAKSLQPIPTFVKPNISGNVNSTVDQGPVDPNNQDTQKTEGVASEEKTSTGAGQNNLNPETPDGKSGALWYVFYLLVTLLIAIFIVRKTKKISVN